MKEKKEKETVYKKQNFGMRTFGGAALCRVRKNGLFGGIRASGNTAGKHALRDEER